MCHISVITTRRRSEIRYVALRVYPVFCTHRTGDAACASLVTGKPRCPDFRSHRSRRTRCHSCRSHRNRSRRTHRNTGCTGYRSAVRLRAVTPGGKFGTPTIVLALNPVF